MGTKFSDLVFIDYLMHILFRTATALKELHDKYEIAHVDVVSLTYAS